MIKEEFGGRKRAGCERGVAAAKERNAIKAHSSRLCFFFFSSAAPGKVEGKAEMNVGVCTQRKTKKHKGAL